MEDDDDDDNDAEDMDELDDAEEFDDELDEFDARRRRAGVRVFNLFNKQQFDYSFLLASATTTVTLARALKVPRFYYYWLALRIHNRDIVSGTYALQLFQTLPSGQDPQEFSAASPSLSLTCGAADTPPALKTITTNNLGPYFKLVLSATQGGAAGAKFYAEMSAVLYARPA